MAPGWMAWSASLPIRGAPAGRFPLRAALIMGVLAVEAAIAWWVADRLCLRKRLGNGVSLVAWALLTAAFIYVPMAAAIPGHPH